MSFSSSASMSADDPSLSGMDVAQEPTNQEAISALYWNGRQQVGVQWLSPVYNQVAVEAPSTRPGKK